MFSRLLSLPLLLGAAVGVPYVATHGPELKTLFGPGSATDGSPVDAHAALLQRTSSGQMRPPAPQGPGATLYPTETPLEGLSAASLQEIFNMNVSKEWVYQRWARKSTALSELGLFGIRVPLVTGTQLHDLAGSLTYFFGSEGRVRRISFHGTTGDTSHLVMLVARHYGLQRQSTPVASEQLFQIRRQNDVFSELRTRPAAVLWASSPHDSFAVDLDLQSPDVSTPLPSRLLPLPVAKVSPLPQPAAAANQAVTAQNANTTANSSNSQHPVDSSEKWKPYFPRSRVPNKQVDNLDRQRWTW